MTTRMLLLAAAVLGSTMAGGGVAAAAGTSPFCKGGMPTPKWICDVIKANTKPKPAASGAMSVGAAKAPR